MRIFAIPLVFMLLHHTSGEIARPVDYLGGFNSLKFNDVSNPWKFRRVRTPRNPIRRRDFHDFVTDYDYELMMRMLPVYKRKRSYDASLWLKWTTFFISSKLCTLSKAFGWRKLQTRLFGCN
ncbi:unnamed protein product [Cylicocyclus nassatus]|uniref:Uncharacterized protein n=1 Tax=Cylicocyclus nassatus TaxID=53992 RepID=A0AA36M356_CYLNA|nr:unnamed protein product [Cylicocyclus nassatus]